MNDLVPTSQEGPSSREVIEIEELKSGSTVLVLEAALAMQMGKLAPVGYDKVADFFRREHGSTTPAHNIWLLVEAELAERLDEAKREFPESQRLARYLLDDTKTNHPGTIATIKSRVEASDWSLRGARRDQENAANIFRSLFR